VKPKKTGSLLIKSIPILGGLFIGGVVILMVKSSNSSASEFWTYTMIAGAFLVGCALTVWVTTDRTSIEKEDLEVWRKYEKRNWSQFVLQETFAQPILFLITLGLGGLLLLRDYRNDESIIDHIALYLTPTLLMVVVNFLSATKIWHRMAKAMEVEKYKIP